VLRADANAFERKTGTASPARASVAMKSRRWDM
jgi:hypothetical protein